MAGLLSWIPRAANAIDGCFTCKLHPLDEKRKGCIVFFHLVEQAAAWEQPSARKQQPGCSEAAGLLVLPEYRV
jgi:hypothetical protein